MTTTAAQATASKEPFPRDALIVLLGRGISNIGSAFTTFGLDVWIYRSTGSFALFSYLALLATLPSLVFAPFAGVIADRWDRKKLLLAGDAAALSTVLAVFGLYAADRLSVAAVATAIVVLATTTELRWAVMGATMSQLASRSQMGRLNAFQQTLRAVTTVLGPILGAIGLGVLGLRNLLLADAASYLVAMACLAWVHVPRIDAADAPAYEGFFEELTFGLRWVARQPGLRRLLVFFMVINLGVSIFTVSTTPFILSFASNHTLGIANGLVGGGAFLAGILLFRRGARQDESSHETAIVRGAFAFGMCMLAWGLCRHAAPLWVAAFALGVIETFIMVASQTIWQLHVPAPIQGKVFAVRTMLSLGLTPLSILIAVPLASTVFGGLLLHSPALASAWGQGQGAAIGLMVSTLGLGVALAAAFVASRGGLRISSSSDSPVPAAAAQTP